MVSSLQRRPREHTLPRRRMCGALLAGVAAWLAAASASAAAPVVGRPRGRPHIRFDRVEIPGGLANREEYLAHLKKALKREAHRADWGASAKNTISLRFEVDRLELVPSASVLQVRCSAIGELPHRRTARSQLSYGGERAQERRLVKQVLEIVARGVVSRLSALERSRRGLG